MDKVNKLVKEVLSPTEANLDLVDEYESSGYQPWFSAAQAEAANLGECECCGHQGCEFKGFQKGSHGGQRSLIAISICPECGHQEEF